MRKKILCTALVLVFILSALTGCNVASPTGRTTTKTSEDNSSALKDDNPPSSALEETPTPSEPTPIPGDMVITFPDKNFEAAIRETIDKPTGDITYADISGVTRLDVSGEWGGSDQPHVYRNIKSLSGIEYFTALEWLDCSTAQLTELDLSRNTVLTYLNCGNNSLTKLNISKNTMLTELLCYMNQLTELDVNKNGVLTNLECQENNLTKLEVSNNIALVSLDCSYNPLTELDVSNNTALTYIVCDVEYSSDWSSYSPAITIIGLDKSRTYIDVPAG